MNFEKLQDTSPDQEITLSELCKLYLAHQQQTKRPQTYQRDQSVIPLVVAALGNDIKANKLSARHIIQSLEKAKSKNTTRNTYLGFLKRQSEKIIKHRISPHALRHTHVSLLAEQGVSLDVISRRVGHEGSDVTKKIYLHITEKQKEKDREKVEKVRLLG